MIAGEVVAEEKPERPHPAEEAASEQADGTTTQVQLSTIEARLEEQL